MWQDNNPITQQPGFNPNFMGGQPQPGYPQGGYPPGGQQQYPMNQYPQPQQPGYPPPGGMYAQQPGPYGPPQPGMGYPPQQQGPYGYGPQMQQPMVGGGMGPQGGGGMMNKVMGVLNDVVDVNPMNSMHSTGNIITGHKGPPLMPMAPVEGCPMGLELLLGTEHLLVKQQTEIMETLLEQVGIPLETPNRYDILNTAGQRIYFAAETGGLLGMQCAPSGSTRQFSISVSDFSGRTILNIERSWSCLFCCLSTCNCCGTTGSEVKISLGDGSYLGRIVQKFNFCAPLFAIEDDGGNRVAEITGPTCADCCCSCCCTGSCGCDVRFRLRTSDGQEIGDITKKWSGFFQEQITDADTFGVNFPQDMEVRAKAMILGAVFLIDFMFFESNPQVKRDD